MNEIRNHDGCELILTTDGQCITLILSSAGGSENDSVTLDRDIWNAIVPIALSKSPDGLAEFVSLDFGPDEADAIGVEVDGHVLSLFWLVVVIECCEFLPTVVRIADRWIQIPLSDRIAWWQQANSDKPLHAQILATNFEASLVLEDEVPAWLPQLIAAARSDPRLPFAGPGLHWTHASSRLGNSCIAFLDDESDNHDACLAFSDCPVSCGAADGSMQGAAVQAIDQLIAFLDMVEADGAVARRVGWEVSCHELIAISATLQKWRDRLEGPKPDHT